MSSRHTSRGVVVGVDESPNTNEAVRWAACDAELRKIPLTLVHAISPEIATWPQVRLPPGLARWQQDRGRRLVDEAFEIVETVSGRGGPAEVHTEVLHSNAVSTLVDLSKNAEMVVAGRRGTGQWAGRPMGSVSSRLLRYAHCPVAIVPNEGESTSPDKPSAGAGRDRRLTHLRAGDRDRLRRSFAPQRRIARTTRVG